MRNSVAEERRLGSGRVLRNAIAALADVQQEADWWIFGY